MVSHVPDTAGDLQLEMCVEEEGQRWGKESMDFKFSTASFMQYVGQTIVESIVSRKGLGKLGVESQWG
jgi:hypothetical protein